MPDLPIVCTLTPDALRARREGLLTSLLRQSNGHELLPEGLRLQFVASAETLAEYRASRRSREALLSVSPLHDHG